MNRLFFERAAIVAKNRIKEIDESLAPKSGDPPQVAEAGILKEIERVHIERTDWTISGNRGATVLLGVDPSTVRSRIPKLGIKRSGPPA